MAMSIIQGLQKLLRDFVKQFKLCDPRIYDTIWCDIPQPYNNAYRWVKGSGINHSEDSFMEGHLLYCTRTIT